jgi:hypothetical protein
MFISLNSAKGWRWANVAINDEKKKGGALRKEKYSGLKARRPKRAEQRKKLAAGRGQLQASGPGGGSGKATAGSARVECGSRLREWLTTV